MINNHVTWKLIIIIITINKSRHDTKTCRSTELPRSTIILLRVHHLSGVRFARNPLLVYVSQSSPVHYYYKGSSQSTSGPPLRKFRRDPKIAAPRAIIHRPEFPNRNSVDKQLTTL